MLARGRGVAQRQSGKIRQHRIGHVDEDFPGQVAGSCTTSFVTSQGVASTSTPMFIFVPPG